MKELNYEAKLKSKDIKSEIPVTDTSETSFVYDSSESVSMQDRKLQKYSAVEEDLREKRDDVKENMGQLTVGELELSDEALSFSTGRSKAEIKANKERIRSERQKHMNSEFDASSASLALTLEEFRDNSELLLNDKKWYRFFDAESDEMKKVKKYVAYLNNLLSDKAQSVFFKADPAYLENTVLKAFNDTQKACLEYVKSHVEKAKHETGIRRLGLVNSILGFVEYNLDEIHCLIDEAKSGMEVESGMTVGELLVSRRMSCESESQASFLEAPKKNRMDELLAEFDDYKRHNLEVFIEKGLDGKTEKLEKIDKKNLEEAMIMNIRYSEAGEIELDSIGAMETCEGNHREAMIKLNRMIGGVNIERFSYEDEESFLAGFLENYKLLSAFERFNYYLYNDKVNDWTMAFSLPHDPYMIHLPESSVSGDESLPSSRTTISGDDALRQVSSVDKSAVSEGVSSRPDTASQTLVAEDGNYIVEPYVENNRYCKAMYEEKLAMLMRIKKDYDRRIEKLRGGFRYRNEKKDDPIFSMGTDHLTDTIKKRGEKRAKADARKIGNEATAFVDDFYGYFEKNKKKKNYSGDTEKSVVLLDYVDDLAEKKVKTEYTDEYLKSQKVGIDILPTAIYQGNGNELIEVDIHSVDLKNSGRFKALPAALQREFLDIFGEYLDARKLIDKKTAAKNIINDMLRHGGWDYTIRGAEGLKGEKRGDVTFDKNPYFTDSEKADIREVSEIMHTVDETMVMAYGQKSNPWDTLAERILKLVRWRTRNGFYYTKSDKRWKKVEKHMAGFSLKDIVDEEKTLKKTSVTIRFGEETRQVEVYSRTEWKGAVKDIVAGSVEELQRIETDLMNMNDKLRECYGLNSYMMSSIGSSGELSGEIYEEVLADRINAGDDAAQIYDKYFLKK